MIFKDDETKTIFDKDGVKGFLLNNANGCEYVKLKINTDKINNISQIKSLLQSAAIHCGIQFLDTNPGEHFNQHIHELIYSSDDFHELPNIKEHLLRLESKWDINNIMWLDSVGWYFVDKSTDTIVKSKVLVYKKEYIQ